MMRGTALSEGIGEALTKLPPVPACRVLIAKPPVSVSTKYVYENLRADRIESHPDIDGMMEALKEGDLYLSLIHIFLLFHEMHRRRHRHRRHPGRRLYMGY